MSTHRHASFAALLVGAAFLAALPHGCGPAPAPVTDGSDASAKASSASAAASDASAQASTDSADASARSAGDSAASAPAARKRHAAPEGTYGTCEPGEGGSGRTYMGREIAEVMGHFGVGWLERPEREREERTDLLVGALRLRPADAVADIGAGSGYFTMRIAPLVPEGVVYATDIQQEMLDIVSERALEENALNVMPVMGEIDHCGLEPNSVDAVLFVDAYHEFSHPFEMMSSIVDALRPDGLVYLVEYRLEDPEVPIKARHKMSAEQATREMSAVGLELVENIDALPQQHILVFRRAGG